MEVIDSFNPQVLRDFIRETNSVPSKDNLDIFFEEAECFKNAVLLTIKSGINTDKYILVRISDEPQKCRHFLEPEFQLRNSYNEPYGAFKKTTLEQFRKPQRNNLGDIKIALKSLARFQASRAQDGASGDYSLLSLKKLKPTAEATVDALQTRLDGLLKDALLVDSVWGLAGNNLFFNETETDILVLAAPSFIKMPPAFDALLYVFSLSDEAFRKEHFEELYAYYFEALNDELGGTFGRKYIHTQLTVLLPVVKCHAIDLLDTPSGELLDNLQRYLKEPLINQEDVYEIVRNKLKSNDYELLDYHLMSLDQTNGHLGKYFHLNVTVKRSNAIEQLKLFAKLIKMNIGDYKDFEANVEKREDFFYNKIYPTFANYGLDELLDFAPECYLSRLSGLLVLDNLIAQNFTEVKPNVILDYEGLKIVLAKLAKLYACSIVVEETWKNASEKPVRLNKIWKDDLEEYLVLDQNPFKDFLSASFKAIRHTIFKFPQLVGDAKLTEEEITDRLRGMVFGVYSALRPSTRTRNVINHGDFYISNTLIKYDEQMKPIDARLIDFQMTRYIPPAYEVLFFIYQVSLKKTRDRHFSDLLDFFYEELAGNVGKHDIDLATVLSKEEFDAEVKRIRPTSLAMAFLYAHMMHAEPEFREEMMHDKEKYQYYLLDHKDEFVDICFRVEHYRRVMKGLVEDVLNILVL